jgi:cystathionine gamma-synthase/methionine-gamma-lyase
MTKFNNKSFATRAVHVGERQPAGEFTPVSTPIYPSVGYTYPNMADLDAVLGNEKEGFVYSARYANPTTAAFEQAIANLEGGESAYAFASGMAALHMALLAAGVKAGSHVVAAVDIYGATYSLLSQLVTGFGAGLTFVDVNNLAEVEKVLEQTRPIVFLAETISNPLLKVADLPRLAQLTRQTNTTFIVDNTFCSPYLCHPLAHGADVVVHSATKYIAGHGDVMAGIVVSTRQFCNRLLDLNKLVGSSLGPFEAWLALRGVKTLPLRMQRQCDNALKVAEWLSQHPAVSQVNYPFLPTHPQHTLMHQLSQGKGAGGVLSFVIKEATRPDIFLFMEKLQLIQAATTLGDIYSLVLYPAMSSHRSLTPEQRAQIGISEGLVRLSIGIEEVADIIADLEQAL